MKTKSTKQVVMWQASIKWQDKWITTPETATLDETLAHVKRAREKATTRFLACNIIQNVHVVLAE